MHPYAMCVSKKISRHIAASSFMEITEYIKIFRKLPSTTSYKQLSWQHMSAKGASVAQLLEPNFRGDTFETFFKIDMDGIAPNAKKQVYV